MKTEKKDIGNRSDIGKLVSVFYRALLNDSLLAPSFAGMDIEKHLPVIVNFWAAILLDEGGYTGNAFEKHLRLELSEKHFEKWLGHFDATVDELFVGEKAELAKQRAHSLGFIFQHKLKGMGKLGPV